jgi:kynurenine formamidase
VRYPSLFVTLFCLVGSQLPTEARGQENNWGKWGANDQIGTLNYITPETIRDAARLVRQGKVISLGVPVDPEGPCGTGAYGKIYRYMISTAQGRGQEAGFAEDHLFTEVHGNSHWDGIAHMYAHGTIYNGYGAETSVTWKGALKNGIQEVSSKVVGRGVLVDIARYKKVRILPGDYLITPNDMEGAARRQGLVFRQGDFILIHTGWLLTWYEQGKEAFWNSESPGIGWEVSQWLKKVRAAAVAMDARNVEFMPCQKEAARKIGLPNWQLPIHVELLRNQGMMIGDLFDLRELAADCAHDGVYEFMFVGPPLNILYGTGSPVNPVAIK